MKIDPQRQILAYFIGGGSLTVKKAWQLFGTTELRKVVSRLKDKGYPISSEWITDTSARGVTNRIKLYRMTGLFD